MDLAQMLEACLDPNSEVRNRYVYAHCERRWRPFQQQHDCASKGSLTERKLSASVCLVCELNPSIKPEGISFRLIANPASAWQGIQCHMCRHPEHYTRIEGILTEPCTW